VTTKAKYAKMVTIKQRLKKLLIVVSYEGFENPVKK